MLLRIVLRRVHFVRGWCWRRSDSSVDEVFELHGVVLGSGSVADWVLGLGSWGF